MPSKPTYRVPLMAEVRELPWNGLSIVSTFSGCGGSCLGFKMAGYRVLWANEFVPAAQDTYRKNHDGTYLDTSDIRAVTAERVRAVIGNVEVDVLEGSPPCASFSTAGKTSKGWGQVRKYSDVEQRTDDLFDQYIRLVGELRPRAFVAENVAGMVTGVAKGFFKRYITAMRKLDYNVEAMVLDAQWLGVPQARRRLIFIGVRKDVGSPRWPAPLPYRYSVRDALPWVTAIGEVPGGDYDKKGRERIWNEADRPSPTIITTLDRVPLVETRVVHDPKRGQPADDVTDRPCPTITVGSDTVAGGGARQQFAIETRRRLATNEPVPDNVAPLLEGYAIGAEWDKLKEGETSDRFFNLVRPSIDAPCPTITQTGGNVGAAGVAHPTERRKFAISELRRICGFPDDFILTGSYGQQWERLGRAVPPPMMRAIAEALVPVLTRERK